MLRDSHPHVLITGATGFLGMEVLARYLDHSDAIVTTLVRAQDDDAAGARIDGVLHELFGASGRRFAGRVQAIAADLQAPNLGLTPTRRDELAARTGTIVHCAASVSFAMPLDESRAINVDGTRRVLALAGRAQAAGALQRFAHVSTAYVAGLHDGTFTEDDHDLGQSFRNAYEQSKFEAERVVRAQTALPWTVLRPSIVVGDRRSGWTAAFNVLYGPLRAFSRGLYPTVPAFPEARVDAVSVDYVADAIFELCRNGRGSQDTYTLAAGDRASALMDLTVLASRYFDRPPPEMLEPAAFAKAAERLAPERRAALERSSVYFPYFAVRTAFDVSRARERLEPRGISATKLEDYLDTLLAFATQTRWGKRPVSRIEALAACATAAA
jgi:thioester reductase-like protein